ncbi:MAG: hypothetical protein V1742_10890 [Pseudomonadota bacterium]
MADLQKLREGKVTPTQGDTRCIAYGHLIRLAIWFLRRTWNKNKTITARLSKVEEWLQDFGGWPEVEKNLQNSILLPLDAPLFGVRESAIEYGSEYTEIYFYF